MTGESAAPSSPTAAVAPTVDEWVGSIAAVAAHADRFGQWPRPADEGTAPRATRAMTGQVIRGFSESQLPPTAWIKAHEHLAPVVGGPDAERLRYTAPPWVAALSLPVEHLDATAQRRLTRWTLEQEAAFAHSGTLAMKWMQTPWEDKLAAAATRVIEAPLPKRAVPVSPAAAPTLEVVATAQALPRAGVESEPPALDEQDLNEVARALRGPHNRWPVGGRPSAVAGRRALAAIDAALHGQDAAAFLRRREAFLARRVLRAAVLRADASRMERRSPRISVSPRMVVLLAPAPASADEATSRLQWARSWEDAMRDECPAADAWRMTSVSERIGQAVAITIPPPVPTEATQAARAVVASTRERASPPVLTSPRTTGRVGPRA